MKVWAITGLIASGKSEASSYFRSKGFSVCDLDDLSRRLIDKSSDMGKEGFSQVYKYFGPSVLDKLGNLDRPSLRKRISQNPHEKQALEEIMNPLLHKAITKVMTDWKTTGVKMGFLEGARIFESGVDRLVAGVITINAPEDQRAKRIVKRDSLGKDEAKLLVQMQDGELIKKLSKFEIKNTGKLDDLKKSLDEFIEKRKAEGF